MESIKIENILFSKLVSFPPLGTVRESGGYISIELFFGKCYCFDTELTNGGWGLSWIIGGQVNPDEGKIIFKNEAFEQIDRRRMSQCMGMDVNDHFFVGTKTIKKQILKGLRVTKNKNAASLGVIMEQFKIDKERVIRMIEHVGAMRFKASAAIGYAFDKKIFCFPWISQTAIINFKDLWLKEQVNFLKSKGCLIIIPTRYSEEMKDLFDEVIEVKHPIS